MPRNTEEVAKERSKLLWIKRSKLLFKYTSVHLTVTQLQVVPRAGDGPRSPPIDAGVKLMQKRKDCVCWESEL